MQKPNAPNVKELMYPTIRALQSLGGSGSIAEIMDMLINNEGYSDEVIEYRRENEPRTELEYRSAWARTYLKKYGAIVSSQRGVFALTDKGDSFTSQEAPQVVAFFLEQNKKKKNNAEADPDGDSVSENTAHEPSDKLSKDQYISQSQTPILDDEIEPQELDWKEELLKILMQIDPSAFERLCQRVLRESGFVKVEVLGKTGDGGLDGVGILQMNLVSFRVHFQCKRYSGSVSNSDIRNFRGATTGRSDRGLFITTGNYTKMARQEANRDGVPIIDLIDGDRLCELLKSLKLGVRTEMVEQVEIDDRWFASL